MNKIETLEQFEKLIDEKNQFLFVKHSLTCPISSAAFEQFKQYDEEKQDTDTYYLAVQEARPLSNYIAETFNVKHESPQALLFSNKQVVWNTSHSNITVQSLTNAVAENIK